ncbi:MAG: DUF1847 domain-containing protein [Planctomycetota bacterium]
MRVAIPLFGTRVSPRCQFARELLFAVVEEGAVVSQERIPFSTTDDREVANLFRELELDVLVCGGLRREVMVEFEASGIQVYVNVAGETDVVLDALAAGRLHSGFGLGDGAGELTGSALPTAAVDCIACLERGCVNGGSCPVDLGPYANPGLRGQAARVYDVGRDVSAESDPALCRIAELVHFCIGAGYERIGIAFCHELYHEAETLAAVLSRFFEVVPVCCRIGANGRASDDAACNPVAQARVLKDAGTDLNVIAGLCLGCDILFTERSHAPVTTLFVKDRSLAHNPVAAIYTRYHLEDLEKGRPLIRSGRN